LKDTTEHFQCWVAPLKESGHVNRKQLSSGFVAQFDTLYRYEDWLSLLCKEAIKAVSVALKNS
jgi:hypothetical protein